MTQMEPTYHLPPNFSIPPDGPFQLGTVIKDFDHHAKMRPLNQSRKGRVEIPAENVYTDHKGGFEATRARLKSGELGIWAKFVGINGVGADAKISAERTENDVYRFDNVETTFFYPTSNYILKCTKLSDVKDYLRATQYEKPVFLVTGVKVAKGVAVRHGRSTRVAASGNIGVNNPEAVPVQTGIEASVALEDSPGFSFSDSSDIIVGIQCYKVYYKKSWLGGGPRLKEELYLAGAQFLEDDDAVDTAEVESYLIAQSDDYDQSMNEYLVESATERLEHWVVPRPAEQPLSNER